LGITSTIDERMLFVQRSCTNSRASFLIIRMGSLLLTEHLKQKLNTSTQTILVSPICVTYNIPVYFIRVMTSSNIVRQVGTMTYIKCIEFPHKFPYSPYFVKIFNQLDNGRCGLFYLTSQ